MPEIKGTDFAKLICTRLRFIFYYYSEYALEGFELNAIDYLLNQLLFSALQAVQKIKSEQPQYLIASDTLTIKSGYDFKLKLADITHIESDSEYVNSTSNGRKIMSYQTLKSLEKTLDPNQFIRVHRSLHSK
jgi:DNA-binding LytR/AlgR family response regulator